MEQRIAAIMQKTEEAVSASHLDDDPPQSSKSMYSSDRLIACRLGHTWQVIGQ